MSSRVRRTEDLFALKTRNLTIQDASGTYPVINSVLVVGDTKGTVHETKTLSVTSVAATTMTTSTLSASGLVTARGLKLTGGTTTITANKTMSASDSNCTFLIDVSSNATIPLRIILPNNMSSLRYKFVMKTATPVVNVLFNLANYAKIINGNVVEAGLGVQSYTTAANMSFSTSATTGDFIQFDGLSSTFVHVNGVCSVVDGIKENKEMIMKITTGLQVGLYTFTLPFTIGIGDSITVNWGDLSSNTYTSLDTNIQHVYTDVSSTSYTITINGKANTFGSNIPSLGAPLITHVEQWGDLGITSFSGAFNRATNLVFVPPILPFGITNLSYMFFGATQFNSDITGWNVSSVTNMSYMFATLLQNSGIIIFNQPLDSWDVSNVTNMEGMFMMNTSFNQPLNSWNVTNVTNMVNMFMTTENFNQSLTNWTVSSVTNMNSMFKQAISFNQTLGSWNVINVNDMSSMFEGAILFNQPLIWNVSNVTNMSSMFMAAENFNNFLHWDVSSVTNMSSMFEGAKLFNQPLTYFSSPWQTQTVTTMNNMFKGATVFNQNLSELDVGNVTNAQEMFCSSGMYNILKTNYPPFGSGVTGYPLFGCL